MNEHLNDTQQFGWNSSEFSLSHLTAVNKTFYFYPPLLRGRSYHMGQTRKTWYEECFNSISLRLILLILAIITILVIYIVVFNVLRDLLSIGEVITRYKRHIIDKCTPYVGFFGMSLSLSTGLV